MNSAFNEKGQGLTEYLILLLLIALTSVAAARTIGTRVKAKLEEAANHINSDITISTSPNNGSSN